MRNISCDLDDHRMELIRRIKRIQENLGIEVDPNESFTKPLVSKFGDTILSKIDQQIIDNSEQ